MLRYSTILLTLLPCVLSLKILIVNPTFGTSHVNFIGAIADTLVDEGHTVHMIANTVEAKIRSYGSKKVHKLVVIPAREPNILNNMTMFASPFSKNSVMSREMMRTFTKSVEQSCGDILMYYDSLLRPLEDENYDIGITQMLNIYPIILLHLMKVKTMVIASSNPLHPALSTTFGIPAPPSYIANPFTDSLALSAPNYSYMERAQSLAWNFAHEQLAPHFMKQQVEMLRAIDPTIPEPMEIVKKSALLLVNTLPMLDHPRPTSNRVINIGGISIKRSKDIDQPILDVINRSKAGVVLISFGSLAKTDELQGPRLDSFLRAFAAFPDHDFIFKLDVNEKLSSLLTEYPNVHMFSWVQQSAILAHPKTRAFISHMGLNSFTETSILGVPIIAIPLFSDQFYNAQIARLRGTGVIVDKMEISYELLKDAIGKVLYDKSYDRNAKLLKRQLQLYPDNGKERMVKFIAYVGEFGRLPNWDLKGAEMNFIQYHCLDIIVPFILAVCLVLYVVFKLIMALIGCACRRSNKAKNE